MAKVKANNKKDIVGNPCMRGQNGQLKLRLKDRLNLSVCGKITMKNLLNKENPWTCGLETRLNIGPVQDPFEELEQAMQKQIK